MSGDFDQISLQVGRILSAVEEGGRQRDAMFRKLDGLGDKISEVKGALQSVTDSHTALKTKVETQIIPAIEDIKATKARAYGLLAGVAMLAGGASAGLTKAVSKVVGQ
jgi:hypothetical protein